jgi:hypothetical protein
MVVVQYEIRLFESFDPYLTRTFATQYDRPSVGKGEKKNTIRFHVKPWLKNKIFETHDPDPVKVGGNFRSAALSAHRVESTNRLTCVCLAFVLRFVSAVYCILEFQVYERL